MTNDTQNSVVSHLTGNASVTLEPVFPVSPDLKSTHLGILLTLPSRMMNIPDEELFEEEYERYATRRNFYETRVGDETYIAIDEGEPVSVLVIPPVVSTGPEMSVELVEMDKTTTERVIVKELIADMIDKIHVIQLKAELSKRGINKSGLKADVLKKLKKVVINNVLMTEDRPA